MGSGVGGGFLFSLCIFYCLLSILAKMQASILPGTSLKVFVGWLVGGGFRVTLVLCFGQKPSLKGSLNFKEMEDDINFKKNRRQPQFVSTWKTVQLFRGLGVDSSFSFVD